MESALKGLIIILFIILNVNINILRSEQKQIESKLDIIIDHLSITNLYTGNINDELRDEIIRLVGENKKVKAIKRSISTITTFSGSINLAARIPTTPYPQPRSSTLSPFSNSTKESIDIVPLSTFLGEKTSLDVLNTSCCSLIIKFINFNSFLIHYLCTFIIPLKPFPFQPS